ncbi:MAG: TolC family protein, partial [Paramuribaculum sp.]|nr:TolC family protein [Paramuribaculum sp.]
KQSFEIGAASYLDLRDSELALTQSKLAYNQSIYNYLVANSELELLLGNTDFNKYNTSTTTAH